MPALVIHLALSALIAVSCFSYGSVTSLSFSILTSSCLALAACWFLWSAWSDPKPLLRTGMCWPLLLFALVAAFQLVPLPPALLKVVSPQAQALYANFVPEPAQAPGFPVSICPWVSAGYLLRLAAFGGVFYMLLHSLRTRRDFDVLMHAIIITGFAVSVLAIVQKYFHLEHTERFFSFDVDVSGMGSFINRNNFAGYVTMVVPLTLGYFFAHESAARRIMYGFAVGVMSLAVVLSQSKGGVGVFFLTLLAFVALGGMRDLFSDRPSRFLLGGLLILVVWIVAAHAGPLVKRFQHFFAYEFGTTLGHGVDTRDILNMWLDYPLLGTGLGTFGNISSRYALSPAQVHLLYAHADWLQVLVESGLAGVLPLVWFLFAYLFSTVSDWLRRRDQYVVATVTGGLISIGGVLIYGVFDFNMQIPANAFLFFVILGYTAALARARFSAAPAHAPVPEERMPRAVGVAGALFGALLCLMLQGAVWQRHAAVAAGREAKQSFARGDLEQGLAHLAAARRMDARAPLPPYAAAEAISENDASRGEEAVRMYAQALALDPANAIYQQRLGAALAAQGNHSRARESFAKALALDPLNISLHIFMANYYLGLKEQDLFDEYYDKTVDLYRASRVQGGPVTEVFTEFMNGLGRQEELSRIQAEIAQQGKERMK